MKFGDYPKADGYRASNYEMNYSHYTSTFTVICLLDLACIQIVHILHLVFPTMSTSKIRSGKSTKNITYIACGPQNANEKSP